MYYTLYILYCGQYGRQGDIYPSEGRGNIYPSQRGTLSTAEGIGGGVNTQHSAQQSMTGGELGAWGGGGGTLRI